MGYLKLGSFCLVKPKRKRSYFRDDKVLKLIGSKIRECRIKKDISQETLANECDLDHSQINRMELGKIDFRMSNFFRIARQLATKNSGRISSIDIIYWPPGSFVFLGTASRFIKHCIRQKSFSNKFWK